MENNLGSVDVEKLSLAEGLIESGELENAREVLNGVTEKDARWHYLYAQLFKKKGWLNESRKQIEIAVRLEPSNSKYINAYDDIENYARANADEVREEDKKSPYSGTAHWKSEACGACGECSCECCLYGICTGICEGCG